MAVRPLVWITGATLITSCLKGPAAPDPARAPPRATVQLAVEIVVKDFEFLPPSVRIPVGGTVTWKFEGPTAHSSTSDPDSAVLWDSGIKGPGESWTRKFEKAGTYPYHCSPHPFMKAKVVVK